MSHAARTLLLAACCFAQTALAADQGTSSEIATWPQWRGPQRDSQVHADPWPDRVAGDALQVRWSLPLQPSYSGPIVSSDLVFVTETQDKQREVVRALDRRTGQQRWQAEWEGALSVPFFAKANGDWIRATPAYDGESLYVAGMRDVLVCLDAQSGAVRWRCDFVERLKAPLPEFGCASSPLVDGDFVYMQAGAGFCKLDKRTGEIIWRTLEDNGGMFGSAFSSPYLTEIGGQRLLLVQTRERLAGVDPQSGQVLWSEPIPAFRGMNILTPTVAAGSVFTSAYGGKSLLYRLDQAAGVTQAWNNKVTGYMSSPVVIGDHIYVHLRNKRFHCINLASGESTWTTQPFGDYWSMVANGDRILALDSNGELLLIHANPAQFELLDKRQVSESPTWAHLAVCGNEVFVRSLDAITVYQWHSAP